MEKTISKIETTILCIALLAVPIALIPIFPDFLTTIKLIILSFSVSVLLIIRIFRVLYFKKLELKLSNFDFPILVITLGYLLSAIFSPANKMEAVFLPGNATLIITGFLFYFLANQIGKEYKKHIITFSIISAVFVAVQSLLSISKIIPGIPGLPEYLKSEYLTTIGGNLQTAIFLAITLPLAIGFINEQKEVVRKIFGAVSLGLITFGVLANIYIILPGKPATPRFADINTYWGITIDTLKESPIWGIGPGNYLTAFNRFRPITYNQTDLWTVRFASARSFYLTIITETGILGLLGTVLLFAVLYKVIKRNLGILNTSSGEINNKLISLLVAVFALAFFPPTTALVFIFFVVFSIASETRSITFHLFSQSDSDNPGKSGLSERIPSIIVTLPVVIAVLLFYYYAVKLVSAEYTFKQGLDALARNDGNASYNLIRQATSKNPFVDRYHATLTQVEFALANAVAQKPEGEEISEQDRSTITLLIQQSIQEAKATVALNQTRSANWELLANLYRNIIPFAQGADQFALQTYNQAIALDPINPNLRLALGGVYYSLGNYDAAIDVFKLAVLTKPDLPNTRYNLAVAYREKGEIEAAINEMTIVLSLVGTEGPDYELAKSELEKLEEKRPQKVTEPSQGEELTPPQPTNEPVIEPPIELPEEAQPPVPDETPQPENTSSPETSPLPSPTAF